MNNIAVSSFHLIILMVWLKWNSILKILFEYIHADLINYFTNHGAEKVFQILSVELRQSQRILS